MHKMLYIKTQDIWMPQLVHGNTPLPTYIVVNTRYMGDMTEEQWIEEYRKQNNCTNDLEFREMPHEF